MIRGVTWPVRFVRFRYEHNSRVAPGPNPTMIGDIATPPFARLPDPAVLFATRAERFRALAEWPRTRPLSALSRRLERLPASYPGRSAGTGYAGGRCGRAGPVSTPCRRSTAGRFTADAALDATFDRLFSLAAAIDMPDSARRGLGSCPGGGGGGAGRNGALGAVRLDPGRDHGRSCLCRGGVAGALRAAGVPARRQGAGAGRRRRLSGLRRRAGRLRDRRLAGRAWRPLLLLLAVRDAMARGARQMRVVRVDQGHRLPEPRRRRRQRQSRNLRELPRLREEFSISTRTYVSIRSPTTSQASGSICSCARAVTGAARSILSCSAIEGGR